MKTPQGVDTLDFLPACTQVFFITRGMNNIKQIKVVFDDDGERAFVATIDEKIDRYDAARLIRALVDYMAILEVHRSNEKYE